MLHAQHSPMCTCSCRMGRGCWSWLRRGSSTTPAATARCSKAVMRRGRWQRNIFSHQRLSVPSSGLPRQLILCSPRELVFLSSIFLLLAPALYVLSQTSMLYWHAQYHSLWPIKMCFCLCSWKWVPIPPRQRLASELLFRRELIRSYQGSGFTNSSETKQMHAASRTFSTPESCLQCFSLWPWLFSPRRTSLFATAAAGTPGRARQEHAGTDLTCCQHNTQSYPSGYFAAISNASNDVFYNSNAVSALAGFALWPPCTDGAGSPPRACDPWACSWG